MKTIYNSGFEAALNKDEVITLEKMLNTRFINIASFLSLDDKLRVFERLLEDHSIIKVNHMDGTWIDYAKYPLNMFSPLQMFVTEDEPNKTLVEFKADGKKHTVPLIDWPDLSGTFEDINDRLTDSEFVCLDASYHDETGVLHTAWTWFMVPNSLSVSELCGIVGYSATRPL